MEIILVMLITGILTSALVYINEMSTTLVPIALYADNYMGNVYGTSFFDSLSQMLLQFGISLIILKFAKKGFDIYVMWNGSGAEEEPWFLLINFIKAMVIAICFPVMYLWTAGIVEELIDNALIIIGVGTNFDWQTWIAGITTLGIMTGILGLVFVICYFLLYIQFIMRGLEMMILRLGMPIACTGLLDNDGGIFKPYIMTMFKSFVTIIVQIIALKLALGLMLNNHMIWGLGAILLALRTPKFLVEFMIPMGSPSGVVNNMYHSVRLAGMARNFIR